MGLVLQDTHGRKAVMQYDQNSTTYARILMLQASSSYRKENDELAYLDVAFIEHNGSDDVVTRRASYVGLLTCADVRCLKTAVKACPHHATNCCRKRQQIVARNGNLLPDVVLWTGL